MDFLVDLKKKTTLRQVDDSEKADRSLANTKLAGKDNLDDEAERWKYFFDSGCSAWFEDIKAHTFTSSFCTIAPAEAQIIVNHWEQRGRACEEKENDSTIDLLFEAARSKLEPLRERLETAMSAEVALSPVGLVFVKLSTRSPKDSKKAFAKAKDVYFQRLQELISRGEGEETNANTRWRILCEETTRSGAVSTSSAALELLLDSDRVYEDLEYALRGPPLEPSSLLTNSPQRHWNMDLVARAWDPRLKPESEFRGICWGGVLTCLCQYYHPLYFTVLEHLKDQIERDIRAVFSDEKVCSAVAKLGGHCIIDFAWLGPNTKVIIVELNPFDGVCLGTFPASTGLFLWDVPEDRAVMRGEKPFEFRIRTTSLDDTALKAQCNPDWRDLIYSGNSGNYQRTSRPTSVPMLRQEGIRSGVKVGSFNMLAEGLAENEFMAEGGHESTKWSARGPKLVAIIADMLSTCDVIVTQENDHFPYVLQRLEEDYALDVGGIYGPKADSTAKRCRLDVLYEECKVLAQAGVDGVGGDQDAMYSILNHTMAMAKDQAGGALTSKLKSYIDESALYGEFYASLQGRAGSDLYVSDDGIGIFYRKDKLRLHSTPIALAQIKAKERKGGESLTSAPPVQSFRNMQVVAQVSFCLKCDFVVLPPIPTTTTTTTSSTSTSTSTSTSSSNRDIDQHAIHAITIYGAHLASGEEYSKELRRIRQLAAMLEDAETHCLSPKISIPIIAMDSNNSSLYEQAYKEQESETGTETGNIATISSLVDAHGFVDLLTLGSVAGRASDHNECFKLRHGFGQQVKKHYKFMFDSIDKILVHKDNLPLPYVPHSLPYEHDYGFQKYDPSIRSKVLQLRSSYVSRAEFERMCRASTRVASTCDAVTAFAASPSEVGDRDRDRDEDRYTWLSGVYPNPKAPSDHPPVSAFVSWP